MDRMKLELFHPPTAVGEPGLCTPEGNVACRLSIRHQLLPVRPNAPRVLRRHGFFPDSLQRLLGLSRSDALPNRRQQKSGLAPTLSCDPFPSEGRVYSHCTAKARYAPNLALGAFESHGS